MADCVEVARRNWCNWRDVFEHKRNDGVSPLFNTERFAAFCSEYSVGRTVRKGTRDKLRELLARSAVFSAAMRQGEGRALDDFEKNLRKAFGTHRGERRITSILSKIAAFNRPEKFIAWDRFAREGLRVVSWPDANHIDNYEEYLSAVNTVWSGELGTRIKKYCKTHARNRIELEACFQRRVLDVCLMYYGGREMKGIGMRKFCYRPSKRRR